MNKEQIRKLLENVKTGELGIDGAIDKLKDLPYEEMGFVTKPT